MEFHPSGGQLAVIWPRDEGISAWDLSSGRRAWTTKIPEQLTCVRYSPDGSRMAVTGSSGDVMLWDAASGTEVLRLPNSTEAQAGATGFTAGLTFSADGRLVGANDWRGGIAVWETALSPDAARSRRRKAAQGRAFAWHVNQFEVSRSSPYAAAFHLAQLGQLGPPGQWHRVRRGNGLACLGHWEKACNDLASGLGEFHTAADWLTYAGLLLMTGDLAGYDRFASELMTRTPDQAGILVRAATLRQGDRKDAAVLASLVEQTARQGPGQPSVRFAQGLVHYRAGNYRLAVEVLRSVVELRPDWEGRGSTELALAYHRREQHNAARQALGRGERWRDQVRGETYAGIGPAPASVPASEWVSYHVLRAEVATLGIEPVP
jgi:hypothetical protein